MTRTMLIGGGGATLGTTVASIPTITAAGEVVKIATNLVIFAVTLWQLLKKKKSNPNT